MSIFDNIVRLCDKNNITITELERKLEFGSGTIFRWKNSSPSVENLQKVANHFKVKLEKLMKGDA